LNNGGPSVILQVGGRSAPAPRGEEAALADETIFDKILAGEAPADVVHDDEHLLAFRDINPQAPVHVVVIPRQKVRSFAELATLDAAAVGVFMQGVSRVAAKLGLEGPGYRVVFNCGRQGQQTVDYLHAHILGGRQMRWPPG
jgi:histidine triad (HIT) family protein